MMKKWNIALFIQTQKQKQLLMKVLLMILFESVYSTIISNIQKSPGKGSGWIIDSVIDQNINIWKYNSLTVAVISNYQKN